MVNIGLDKAHGAAPFKGHKFSNSQPSFVKFTDISFLSPKPEPGIKQEPGRPNNDPPIQTLHPTCGAAAGPD